MALNIGKSERKKILRIFVQMVESHVALNIGKFTQKMNVFSFTIHHEHEYSKIYYSYYLVLVIYLNNRS